MKPKKKTRKRQKRGTLWLVLGSAGGLALIAWFFFAGAGKEFTESGARLVSTMSPSYFSRDPRAQAAYQAAKDIPEVLAELPCFCGCMSSFGHENNLFCFRDEHGSGCSICEDIALDARDMHRKGQSIEQIQQTIRQKYGRPAL
jgi:Protein of unknown function with PCYCGC motif